ncbi:ThiF family adenylyltransferase [Modestobacter roseus]|uniref:ThiF family adenylyltransferase n=1 Tax=Modestobacter roseus TaxID=1181884 RepID=UPI0034E001FA
MTETPHPLLPATTPVTRPDEHTVQVGGADGRDGVRVWPAGPEVARLLTGIDGRRTERTLRGDWSAAGLDDDVVEDLLAGLRGAGLLREVTAGDLLATDPGPAAAARAGLELPTVAAGRWRTRRQSSVVVEGATRVGTPLAALLAASGVGRVSVRDRGLTTAGEPVVGGVAAHDEGRPRVLAAADAIRRASPLTDLRPLPATQRPDLVLLCRPWAAVDPLTAALQRDGVPHLVATVRGDTGVVGPLVLPGVTSCLRCADGWRREDDPSWPATAAQLATARPAPAGSTLTCLATAVTAAVQALAHLDGGDCAPGVLDAALELGPPTFQPRLRRWPPHPGCGCGARQEGVAEREVAAERGQWGGE